MCIAFFLRKEGDSNPRNAFDVYTLSRRALYLRISQIYNLL